MKLLFMTNIVKYHVI